MPTRYNGPNSCRSIVTLLHARVAERTRLLVVRPCRLMPERRLNGLTKQRRVATRRLARASGAGCLDQSSPLLTDVMGRRSFRAEGIEFCREGAGQGNIVRNPAKLANVRDGRVSQ